MSLQLKIDATNRGLKMANKHYLRTRDSEMGTWLYDLILMHCGGERG